MIESFATSAKIVDLTLFMGTAECRNTILCGLEGGGCCGSVQLHLIWQTTTQQRPKAVVNAALEPIQASRSAADLSQFSVPAC